MSTPRQKRILSDDQQRQHSFAKSINKIDSVELLYRASALDDSDTLKNKALLMLMLRSWLTNVSSFDPVTGYALHTGVVDFMDIVAKSMLDEALQGETKDRIYKIVSHTKDAILTIMEHTRDTISREYAMLPIHAAREVDSNSVQWLSRQPGRTLREKLSGKPYIKAVKRITSVDTSENRLLKAFFLRLEQILIERQNALDTTAEETCEELLVSLQRWFRSEDASEIGTWGNMPPNNALLQDKRYRKVWDGWLWLQSLDENIKTDSKRIHRDILKVIYWETLSLLNHTGRFRAIQQPVNFDYDNFVIFPELPIQGYLFPACNSKIKGKIKNINYEKNFGFLIAESGTGLFFHKNNLSNKLDINSLKIGDVVSFIIGSNRQGECADNVTLKTNIVLVNFSLSNDKCDIQIGEEEFSLQIDCGHLFIQQPQGTKKKLELTPETIKEISKTILSLVTDSSFEYSSAPKNNQSSLVRMDGSVINLCSIRPMFTNTNGSQILLPFRLLKQKWKTDNEELTIDCGKTKAINFSSDIETVSMKSLFSHNSKLSDAAKSSSSMFFTKKLSDYIQADKLTYLVPDWGNDFDLECIRKSINFYFNESTPLPKSIAAIFAWQSSKKFLQDNVRENDFVLVVDVFDGGVSITPVQAIYQKELDVIIPETQGISWERHPTVIIENKSTHSGMVRNLNKDGCQVSEELIQFFGFEGLTSDAGEVSFVNDGSWYHLPVSIREVLNQYLDVKILSNDTIGDCLNSTNRYCRGVNVFILPVEDTIKKPELQKNYKWLGSAWSPIKGCQTLNEWQKGVCDIALWRDHLPELSIKVSSNKGYAVNFYLVKDATVTPQRGRTVDIPVQESFMLAAGQTHYSFPLLQGEGGKKLQFVAYLKSPAFPLKEVTKCKLKMTYTYGADEPYELKFIPSDPACADFKSIRVEWRSASDTATIDLESLPVPDFPARKSWSDFQKLPKDDDTGFSDLLDWVESEISKIIQIANFINDNESSNRIYRDGMLAYWNWKEDKNGEKYCSVNYNFGDVFFHERNFEEFNSDVDKISFDLEEQRDRKGYIARNITLGKSIPKRTVERLRKSLRFPVLTIWNHGHSLSESDVPENFRNTIFEGIQKILLILESENMPDTLKEELFFFLSCLHKDTPEIVITRLRNALKDKGLLRKYHRNIAFAIGSAELSWQQELLENVISPIDNEGLTRSITMEILSVALWRSKVLISKLAENELKILNQNLYGCLEFDLQKVVNDGKIFQIATLCKHLELLLALLRSRENEDENFKIIFAPHKEMTQKFVTLVNDISKKVIDSNIKLKSRISLQIEKPEMFCNTPDLLYALRMYLTGDSGANTITITGISDED